ncbi:MAG: flagellar export chaperone FliS [bacterium]|nr:flagellar export chaperone FliS [bacterium]
MSLNTQHAHAAYQQGQVNASNPVRIIVLLYDGAIRFTRRGYEHFDDPAVRGQVLGRAHAIVSELQLALNRDEGAEVAANLDRLYRYILDNLLQANIDGARDSLLSVIDVMETLVSGWREVEVKHRTQEQGV